MLWFAGAAKAVAAPGAGPPRLLDPGLREVAAEGRALSALDYLAADARTDGAGQRMGRFHERFDLL